MGETIDAASAVEYEDVAQDGCISGEAPALVPEVNRYQSRDDEAQVGRNEIVVPVCGKSAM